MILVNFACGNRYHKDWLNFDFHPQNEFVKKIDLRKKLPFDDNSVDVVYHSHVLEHLKREEAKNFIKECFRILKERGIIRVVVPDLEQIVMNYIKFLNDAKRGNKDAKEKYEWTLLELFDQMTRNYPGGEMLEYWLQEPIPQYEFILERVGSELKNFLKSLKNLDKKNFIKKRKNLTPEEIGKFRLSGEVHYWMYDEFSLGKLLKETGFRNVKRVKYNESQIKNFNSYLLDCEEDGSIRKPDSLFMEAIK